MVYEFSDCQIYLHHQDTFTMLVTEMCGYQEQDQCLVKYNNPHYQNKQKGQVQWLNLSIYYEREDCDL
jgi:hypothetical protein